MNDKIHDGLLSKNYPLSRDQLAFLTLPASARRSLQENSKSNDRALDKRP
jgi:hypothetical protein